MDESLPASFYRAEAAWLEYTENVRYSMDEYQAKKREIEEILQEFGENCIGEVEDLADGLVIFNQIGRLREKIGNLLESLEEIENNLESKL